MNKINYDENLQKVIDDNKAKGVKPSLLLHSCCAPCSSYCIERLIDAFSLTVYYYNPNIDNDSEYQKRVAEQVRFCDKYNIKTIVEDYNPKEFYDAVKGYEGCLEGGDRCAICFDLRLKRTAQKCKELGFKYFATTLTVSPLKNAERINDIGDRIEKEINANYLPTDFKKRGGYIRSIELSKEYGLYRQNYCGCTFSKREK